MKNILITGSVLGATRESVMFYENLVSNLKNKDIAILSPLDTMKFKGTDVERFERAKKSIENADIVIAEISSASHGQGMELMLAQILNKQVVFIARAGAKISGLIKGAFPHSTYITYEENLTPEQFDDIKDIINNSKQNIQEKI